MNELQKVFSYSGNEVRTVINKNDVWFVASDVCKILDIQNVTQALQRLEEDERSMFNIGRQGKVNIINESGLYEIIFASRKQEARAFKKWVKQDVLPTIRKHGAYMTDDVLEKTLNDPDYMIGLISALKEEKSKRLEAEKTVNILTHVTKTYTATEIAKELGFKSASALNKDLAARKIQFNQNGTWVFYSKYADKGYVEIKQDVLDNGRVIYHRRFTQMGREFLLRLFESKAAG
ncbi:BRO family protein [Fictibacillus sp. 26RED30]|uniref:BRO family protein n=1 Tax=Fictibacillus sp. 26RED30 TaxID=2745877 RepID=UPI0018CFDCEA|nr:BRO family protein [Fictibacillus sp. 26RED30]MBH0159869.1 phage antirepressor KilAC domain-containing protein [Fictibacillus sp. 26RED30]